MQVIEMLKFRPVSYNIFNFRRPNNKISHAHFFVLKVIKRFKSQMTISEEYDIS